MTEQSAEKAANIITFGCRLNTYESEVIRSLLQGENQENTFVFNTCGVTAEAERQARQAIRKARRENPEARIIVTGCAAQMNPDKFATMPEVDQVLGNEEKLKRESYTPFPVTSKVLVDDIMEVKETALHLISGFENRVRAFIQVQNGCNHRCTFCRIPYGRGNSRSVPVGEIVTQIRTLVESGYKEIVLTGVDITDYGKDLPGSPSLGQMVRRLLTLVPGLQRLRISSLDPVEVDEELKALIFFDERVMPHLHLSLQSGDNLILKRMKRRHLREDVLAFHAEVKHHRPDVAFGADIIAGFPTESEEMFQNSLKIIEECDLAYLHVFPFSHHSGTPAARMPQLAKSVIKQRAARLREAGQTSLERYLTSLHGKTVSVLVEQKNMGHTETFAAARFTTPVEEGMLLQGRVLGHQGETLLVEKMA